MTLLELKPNQADGIATRNSPCMRICCLIPLI